MSDLPKNWSRIPLNSLCDKIRGVSYTRGEASSVPKDGYSPIVRANNIGADSLLFNDLVWVPNSRISDHQKLRTGDIVVAMSSGSKSVVGKAAQLQKKWDGSFGAFCGALRPSPKINNRYLGLFLQTFEYRSKISELAAGSNINNLKNEHFAEILVPVPPLTVQEGIVKRLESLIIEAQRVSAHLDTLHNILKRFRQSVIAAGCKGLLTSDLLHDDTSKSDPIKGWETISADSLFEFITSGSRGWAEFYSDTGPIFIRIGNLDHDSIKLDLSNIQHVNPPKNTEGIRTRVKKGDILISITADVGMVAYIDYDIDESYINQHIALARPNNAVDSRFLAYYIAQSSSQKQLRGLQRGATKVGLTLGDIRKLELTIPKSLEEQKEIVRRIESLLSFTDKLEAEYASAKAKADKLTQSILSKAFRGELVS